MEMLKNTGHEEISLSSLSSSDYSKLPELIDFLIEECDKRHINISLPSLRIDAFSLDVMSKVQDVKKSSLTFAPEAGSKRLRDVINKGLTEEVILQGSALAFEGGWTRVKLYFMLVTICTLPLTRFSFGTVSKKVAAILLESSAIPRISSSVSVGCPSMKYSLTLVQTPSKARAEPCKITSSVSPLLMTSHGNRRGYPGNR